ncbi:hypothetical protein EVAR_24971_1 [Eumeta japonica]|uniref:Uncharacterized protein n=1 Tax=Eumeta variegata TaxID=151549 RepID=A0A4C1ZNF6_EUMVA|nr:hypothetical protein EVAR_24971_1 [Eumeta japonica]
MKSPKKPLLTVRCERYIAVSMLNDINKIMSSRKTLQVKHSSEFSPTFNSIFSFTVKCLAPTLFKLELRRIVESKLKAGLRVKSRNKPVSESKMGPGLKLRMGLGSKTRVQTKSKLKTAEKYRPVFDVNAALYDLQTVQNKFCKNAADAPWYVRKSVLHRHLELPTISKFMKDASGYFFYIASSHSNLLLVSAVSYEPPPPHHFCRRQRNVLLNPPDVLTVVVENL